MRKKSLLTFLALVGAILPLAAQQRGVELEGGTVEVVDTRANVVRQGKQWAIFIAIDEYREWPTLKYPVKDAQAINKILLEYYYIDEVRKLYNRDATVVAIRRLLTEIKDKTGPNDSVFVFHAGHGISEGNSKTSAWITYDGSRNTDDQGGWLSHTQIRSFLDSMNARHVFLISDSCYSGDLLDATRGIPETFANYPAAYDKKSRQVMSSGASETVADESEFASRLKNLLSRTETPYVTPLFLCSQIIEAKTTKTLATIPNLGPIPQSGHEIGGSFLFFRKNPSVVQPPPEKDVNPPGGILPPPPPPPPGENGYFVGSWVADAEYNGSFDTYYITFFADGRCKVKIENDTVQQETNGNWSWDGSMFKIRAIFRNPAIAYQQSIQWTSPVSYSGGNSFNILGRAATNARNQVRFTFFREFFRK